MDYKQILACLFVRAYVRVLFYFILSNILGFILFVFVFVFVFFPFSVHRHQLSN